MKKINERTRTEQFFILLLTFVSIIGILCATGCSGRSSCETPKCSNDEIPNKGSAKGFSIPGCLGCKSCKGIAISGDENNAETEEGETFNIYACDFICSGGCLGCGTSENSYYFGCVKGDDIDGLFYGSSESDETVVGCYEGHSGCTNSEHIVGIMLKLFEGVQGIN